MSGIAHLMEFLSWLSTNGCGTIGQTLIADARPDLTPSTGAQAAACFVMEIPGREPAETFSRGSYIRRPRFRIDCRSTAPGSGQADYPNITNARNLAQTAYEACRLLAGQQLVSTAPASTGNWLMASPEQEPYLNGRDEQNRVTFSFVVSCARQGP